MKKLIYLLFLLPVSLLHAQNLDIQGHRGARGLLPENTIPAFIKAIDEGVTTLELDVVVTKDKKIVLSHEPFLSHEICLTLQGSGINKKEERLFNIYQMTYEEVREFDCGSKPHPRFPDQQKMKVSKPLLIDLIRQVEMYLKEKGLPKVNYNIELKSTPKGDGVFHPGVKEFSDLVFDALKNKLPKERFTIQCFDFRILQYWHQAYPEIELVTLVENMKGIDKNLEALGFMPAVYSPYYQLLTQKDIDYLHQKGIKVIPWTINSRKEMQKMAHMGVDGIITDYPDRAKGLKVN